MFYQLRVQVQKSLRKSYINNCYGQFTLDGYFGREKSPHYFSQPPLRLTLQRICFNFLLFFRVNYICLLHRILFNKRTLCFPVRARFVMNFFNWFLHSVFFQRNLHPISCLLRTKDFLLQGIRLARSQATLLNVNTLRTMALLFSHRQNRQYSISVILKVEIVKIIIPYWFYFHISTYFIFPENLLARWKAA